jgi:hypothetical protein
MQPRPATLSSPLAKEDVPLSYPARGLGPADPCNKVPKHMRQKLPLSITMPAPEGLIVIEPQIGWIAYLNNLGTSAMLISDVSSRRVIFTPF